jgi:hypothetical protein
MKGSKPERPLNLGCTIKPFDPVKKGIRRKWRFKQNTLIISIIRGRR